MKERINWEVREYRLCLGKQELFDGQGCSRGED